MVKLIFTEKKLALEDKLFIRKIFYCLVASLPIFFGQAIKGCWWMPGHQQAMKDAQPAISFGELEKSFDPEISEWGNPMD